MNPRGRFAVSLLLLILAPAAFAATKHWTGAGGNALWSNSANWQESIAPADGDDLVFTVGDTVTLSTTNDFAAITIHSISAVKRNVDTFIHGTAEVDGNALRLTGTLTNNVILQVNVTLAASQSWIASGYPSAPIVLGGTVNLNGYTLTAGGIKNGVNFDGDVVGTGAIVASGACDTGGVTFNGHVAINGPITQVCGPVTFTNTNTFSGPLTLTGSVNNNMQLVSMETPGAFPSGCQVLFSDNSTAELRLGPNSLTQASLSGSGSIRLNGGSVTLTNAPHTTLHGFIYGPGSLNITGGNQTLSLGDAITTTVSNNATLFVDGANVSSPGTTTVGSGTLQLRNAKLQTVNASGGALSLLQNNSATDVTLSSASNFVVPLGTGQISISGNISIGNSALTLTPESQPQTGAAYKIIWNTGSGSTTGTFAGYPEGSSFTLNGFVYSITYHGGGGKDVVITVVRKATAPTQTALTTSPNPSQHNEPVTLTATVTSGSGTPPGTVTFYDGSTALRAVTLNSGAATYTTSALGVGLHNLTAQYGGSDAFAGSTSNVVSQTVKGGAATSTSLTSVDDTTEVGEPATFMALVQSAFGEPDGTVLFTDAGLPLGVSSIDANGVATFSTSALAPGTHAIIAMFQGKADFNGSASSSVMQTVSNDCPFPIFASTLTDTTVAPHSDVMLRVTTASGQQEQFAWFSGTYPDVSQPLGVTSPALTLLNLESSARLWVRVTNACGSVYSAAMVAVPTPPRRRSVPH